MTEEGKNNYSRQEVAKKGLQALLEMAKVWGKSQDTIHHAIKSYKDVIRIDPESSEADEARAALWKIAEQWNKRGQKYAAALLYKELTASS
ncbi:MAG: hypothetical protein AAB588_01900 [Patescibacteria group bacterium]